jgi:hypothetical protein
VEFSKNCTGYDYGVTHVDDLDRRTITLKEYVEEVSEEHELATDRQMKVNWQRFGTKKMKGLKLSSKKRRQKRFI